MTDAEKLDRLELAVRIEGADHLVMMVSATDPNDDMIQRTVTADEEALIVSALRASTDRAVTVSEEDAELGAECHHRAASSRLLERHFSEVGSAGTGEPLSEFLERIAARILNRPQTGEVERLRAALEFYARPIAYLGGNQRNEGQDDPFTPADAPYIEDVGRDGGRRARAALAGGESPK